MFCVLDTTQHCKLCRRDRAIGYRNEWCIEHQPFRQMIVHTKNYNEMAKALRREVLLMTHRAQSSHIGSNFSSADLCTVLYDLADFSLIEGGLTKDIVLVKPWNVANVYACLVRKGLLPKEAVDEYGTGQWTTIIEPIPPYIPFGTGAMGYNLPAAVSFALAKKLKKEEGTIYCLISDGECQIGSTWESALLAAHHQLDNLILIIDRNHLQAMGEMKDILNIEPLQDKFRAFGWQVWTIDGHDYDAIKGRIIANKTGNPQVIIANTIKGKGVKMFENDNLWHYSHVNEIVLKGALKELGDT